MCIKKYIYMRYQTVYAVCIFPLSFIVSADTHRPMVPFLIAIVFYLKSHSVSVLLLTAFVFFFLFSFSFVSTIGATVNKFLFLKINYFNLTGG